MDASWRTLVDRLAPADEDARGAVDARSIAYPLGSGEGEERALAAGLKPMIRQLLSAGDLDRTRARWEARGFVTEVAPRIYGPTHGGWDDTPDASAIDPRRARRALFVAKDRAAIAEAVAADLDKTDDGDRALGALLGYPSCCVDAFVASGKQRKNADVFAAALARTSGGPSPRLNVLDMGVFHWIAWTPCSFRCEASLERANALAAIVAREHDGFARAIDAALSAHRLYLADDVQLSLRGAIVGGALTIDEVWPTARDRHPRATLDADAREATARLFTIVRRARALRVDDRALVLDEARVELPSRPLLATFGERQATHAA